MLVYVHVVLITEQQTGQIEVITKHGWKEG